MRLPCPYCGRLVERLVEGMCEECYLERHPLVMLKDNKVLRCKYCGAVFLKGEWVKIRHVEDFSKVLTKKGVVAGVLEKIEISETAEGARALVYIRGTPHPAIEPRLLSYVVEISYEEDVCNSCREMLSKREVAVIQIRGTPRPIDAETEKKIFYITQQELFKLKDKKIGYISNIKKVRNGFDIYTTSTGLARHLAYVIHREFPSLLIESAKA
ncbi:MAG: NMD3-related protein, partial [Pyrobaculum sp.]